MEGLTLSQLIKRLQKELKTHGDIPVICDRYSDFRPVKDKEITIVEAIPVAGDEWMQKDHYTLWDYNKPEVNNIRFIAPADRPTPVRTRRPGIPLPVKCLHFQGN